MVFVRRTQKKNVSVPVGAALGCRVAKGDVGIEIEVEGNKFPKSEDSLPSMWKYTHDGSLRGQDNAEYVLAKPILFSEVPTALDRLWTRLREYGSVIADSNRTSVHVHLNCQNFHWNRLASFVSLYYIFEEVLTEWCGDHRVGNLFCLRGKDAPAILTSFREFIANDGSYPVSEALHYAALNPNALIKFGSLEVRTLRGCTDPKTIVEWVAILERLYTISEKFSDPRTIAAKFSGVGPLMFFEDILGPVSGTVRAGIGMDTDAIRQSMFDGMRLAQDVMYCRDWDEFNTVDVKPDPFGRSAWKVAQSMAQTGVFGSFNESTFLGTVTAAPVSAASAVSYDDFLAEIQSAGDDSPQFSGDYDEDFE